MSENVGIRVEGLTRSFEGIEAVRDLSFSVRPGEIYGLLGPNGAGKTTALRMLATLLRPDAGAAFVSGWDVVSEPIRAKRALGYVTGDTGLYRRLTPPELLRYFGRLYGIEPAALTARIEELSETLGLGAFAKRRCGDLSTGERQRVSIARALVHDPPVLILDEPTSGLDILASEMLLGYLQRARDAGRAVLFSTHIMAEAELLCDRIGVLHEGRLRVEASPAELKGEAGSLAEAFLRLVSAAEGEVSP